MRNFGNDYQILDQFTQRLFIFQHLEYIAPGEAQAYFQQKWGTNWEIAKRLQEYCDKLMEELVDIHELLVDMRAFSYYLAEAYKRYCKLLRDKNSVSFAALLKTTYTLLHRPVSKQKIISQFRYVFVDEYQDTNYVQEQIIQQLASTTTNLCVVGDEDQALYRFRGATVRNILEFALRTANCTTIYLSTNYRSHREIVAKYDRWMASADWTSDGETVFRHNKTIVPDSRKQYPDAPAVFAIEGQDMYDEAEQFADLVLFLKEKEIITDYSQIALLLYSVKPEHSDGYRDALEKRHIPLFCPRARSYFRQKEVCLMLASFAILLDYAGELQGDFLSHESFANYVQKQCITELHSQYNTTHPLHILLQQLKAEIACPTQDQEGQRAPEQHTRLTDFFYRLLAVEPFATLAANEQTMRNLVIFSNILQTFQNFYHHAAITQRTQRSIRTDFFYTFLRLLEDGGINEYEDAEQPLRKGHVQILTIHQAKGLEFPVVVVGSLHTKHMGAQVLDRDLQKFYPRGKFEPEKRIPGFDMMRLYYVAFSRAENLLVLTGQKQKPPQKYFDSLLQGLPRWSAIQNELPQALRPRQKNLPMMKRDYSFTSHIQMYETCPRQYQYFREYNFAPARPGEVFLGLLVHQSIEELLSIAHDGNIETLNENTIRGVFERVYSCLLCHHDGPADPTVKARAFTQIYNYFRQNRQEMQHIVAIEVPVTVEKDGYVLTGRIDLLTQSQNGLEILDFKTAPRPAADVDSLIDYERQLCIYAYAVEKRYHVRPQRLVLYWTAEARREDARMVFRYQPEMVQRVTSSIDATVTKIQAQDFQVTRATAPEQLVCKSCDVQHVCVKDAIIEPFEPSYNPVKMSTNKETSTT